MENETTEEEKQKQIERDRRYALSSSIRDYSRAAKKFELANQEFMKTCQDLRAKLPPESRFIVEIDYQPHLITCDKDGNFELELIDKLY
jgi:hypothetical protein